MTKMIGKVTERLEDMDSCFIELDSETTLCFDSNLINSNTTHVILTPAKEDDIRRIFAPKDTLFFDIIGQYSSKEEAERS